MDVLYSICRDETLISCVVEGYDREKVIKESTDYFAENSDGNQVDVVLVITGDTQTQEPLTLSWDNEPVDAQSEWGTWNHASAGIR